MRRVCRFGCRGGVGGRGCERVLVGEFFYDGRRVGVEDDELKEVAGAESDDVSAGAIFDGVVVYGVAWDVWCLWVRECLEGDGCWVSEIIHVFSGWTRDLVPVIGCFVCD